MVDATVDNVFANTEILSTLANKYAVVTVNIIIKFDG